jgi:hypothetical protein
MKMDYAHIITIIALLLNVYAVFTKRLDKAIYFMLVAIFGQLLELERRGEK